MINFHCGERFDEQIRVERLQGSHHLGVITERQRGMQSADHVDFGGAVGDGFASEPDDFVHA